MPGSRSEDTSRSAHRSGRRGRIIDDPVASDVRAKGAGVARHEQLREEQSAVSLRYARLDALRTKTAERLRRIRRSGPSGSPQNRSERDAFATLYEDRLAQLDAVEQRLTFGRLDLGDGATRYIGRIGLTEPDHTVLLTDWRAPAAQAFYRATAARPEGVVRRRHLVCRRTHGRRRRGRGARPRRGGLRRRATRRRCPARAPCSPPSPRAAPAGWATSSRPSRPSRTPIIRSDLAGALVVQGGPGTGKTAVALHRAAYLLYTHRRTLERSGVLLVGPSRTFLRYIDQVLPSLG